MTREQHPEATGATAPGHRVHGPRRLLGVGHDDERQQRQRLPRPRRRRHQQRVPAERGRPALQLRVHRRVAHHRRRQLARRARHRPRRDHHPALLLHERHARLALRPRLRRGERQLPGRQLRPRRQRRATPCWPRRRTAGTSAASTTRARPTTSDDDDIRCLNNANFGTPGDGSSPRMQMYMWAPGRPYRDGDVDGDVIAHEYGHGVSSRLVGGGTLGYNGGDQRGALGEGWSDVVSYLKWGDAVVGEYVTGNSTTGIRSVAYDNSTLRLPGLRHQLGAAGTATARSGRRRSTTSASSTRAGSRRWPTWCSTG